MCGSGCVHMHLCWSLCVNQNECGGGGGGGYLHIYNLCIFALIGQTWVHFTFQLLKILTARG